MHDWDAGRYLRFADERTRPAFDLVARIALAAPAQIVDLGCGPGNSTAILRQRWPEAAVTGLDSSAAMLERARRDHPGIRFVAGDIAAWRPERRYDLVFAGRRPRAPAAASPRRGGGPGGARRADASQSRFRDTRADAASCRRGAVAGAPRRRSRAVPGGAARVLLRCPGAACRRFVLWETDYIQIMDGAPAIIEWLRGTGLRPFLARLDDDEQRAFRDRYADLLEAAFAKRSDGRVLLPYPRLFFIATPR